MDIFWILDPDRHSNRYGSATLMKSLNFYVLKVWIFYAMVSLIPQRQRFRLKKPTVWNLTFFVLEYKCSAIYFLLTRLSLKKYLEVRTKTSPRCQWHPQKWEINKKYLWIREITVANISLNFLFKLAIFSLKVRENIFSTRCQWCCWAWLQGVNNTVEFFHMQISLRIQVLYVKIIQRVNKEPRWVRIMKKMGG